jgi:4-amino-4-deoxy-L-arabinose transferase-like glycosyltransferase
MSKTRRWQATVFSDTGILILLALLRFGLLFLHNGQSGWHRDELDFLDSARHLAWGYVAYPPFTPFVGRIALTLFGPSLLGVRFFSTLAQALAMVLTGWMARELGGRRWAQVLAAIATTIAPYAILGSVLFLYSSFDYLWWVLIAYLMIRLLKSDDPRWWLGIGAAIGLGMLTKYTLVFLVAGIAVGVILTRTRRYLLSPWLWGGVALAALIVLPNLIWQFRHNWIWLDFIRAIHTRDVRSGRAAGYLIEQFIFTTNLVTIPLWVAGLYGYFFAALGRRYRLMGCLFVVPFALFLYTEGRPYYLAPAYPMLFAAGAVLAEQWLSSWSVAAARAVRTYVWAAFAISGIAFALIALPVAPVNSRLWDIASDINGELKEQIGWPELVETVAGIYNGLPAEEKPQTAILAGNYGEVGAIDLYGPAYGLPQAISGVNSYWYRGYGNPPPQTVIVVGLYASRLAYLFDSCQQAGRITNRYGVLNEETRDHAIILLCRGPRRTWQESWPRLRSFG